MEANLVELVHQVINPDKYQEFYVDHSHGAVVKFLGVVRNVHEGRDVKRIFYECYERMTLRMMQQIEQECLENYPMVKMVLVHRIGMVELGEASVLVCTSSKHRKDSYESSMFIMNRVKELLPIWKKEFHPDGETSWVGIGS